MSFHIFLNLAACLLNIFIAYSIGLDNNISYIPVFFAGLSFGTAAMILVLNFNKGL